MVATATRTILESLDRIPDEDQRTKVAIICYDTSLYFFSIPVSVSPLGGDSFLTPPPTQPGSDSSMLVVSDIDNVILPKPTDLLVNLAESRSSLEALLGRVNDMFQENSIIGSAMSAALQAGFKLMVRFPFFIPITCITDVSF
jgi:protein transport protein SEC24